MSLRKIFLTLGGVGRLRAPEIGASLVALLLGVLLLYAAGAETLFTLAFALFLIGIFEINRYENRGGAHDERSIVIDEAVGLWVALSVSIYALPLAPGLPFATPVILLLSLGSFLLFDLWKPSTIGWIQRNLKGGLGVMLDDVLAGFAAGMLNLLIFRGIGEILKRLG